jgi:hypothetical protein
VYQVGCVYYVTMMHGQQNIILEDHGKCKVVCVPLPFWCWGCESKSL